MNSGRTAALAAVKIKMIMLEKRLRDALAFAQQANAEGRARMEFSAAKDPEQEPLALN